MKDLALKCHKNFFRGWITSKQNVLDIFGIISFYQNKWYDQATPECNFIATIVNSWHF